MADALQNDMGITSPLRPTEFPNPDGLTDDDKPGIDATADDVNLRADYVRTIAIPWRDAPDPAAAALFEQAQCSACHVPTLHTRADYPIAQLADIDAPIYTDMLLHDMGDGLSDSLADGDGVATPRDVADGAAHRAAVRARVHARRTRDRRRGRRHGPRRQRLGGPRLGRSSSPASRRRAQGALLDFVGSL